jgi:cytochrome oxidase Cu insertion factor (SCO1/SenC/PrrC family)
MRGAGHDVGGARRLSRLLPPLLLWCLSASVACAATPDLLIDQFGKPVPPGRLQGHVLLVYFGYTNCPDLCPTALTTMTSVMNLLGPEGADVLPTFVTVDPARDTVTVLRRYATHFHPRLIALTGTAAAIADAARSFNVQYQAQPADAHGYYAVDHSVLLYLADRQGRVVQSFHPRQSAQEIAAAVRARLTAESRAR